MVQTVGNGSLVLASCHNESDQAIWVLEESQARSRSVVVLIVALERTEIGEQAASCNNSIIPYVIPTTEHMASRVALIAYEG